MASASRTRSFRVNSRVTHALCSVVLKLPTPNAPKQRIPWCSTPASLTSMPSMPSGGAAFKSTATLSVGCSCQADVGTICTPAGPELSRISAPSSTCDRADASVSVVASTATSKRALMNWRALSPCSGLREVMTTLTPSRASRPAERWPTGPVPARMTAFLPRRSPRACSILATAATAVVLEPLESSITETVSGLNMASTAMASSCSPAVMLFPPIHTAVFFRCFAPRVKMQPWIRSRTSVSTTLP